MKITPYAIEQITPFIIKNKSGKELVKLFAMFEIRDIYDEKGLPDIGKANGQRPSKMEYTNKRLLEINNTNNLRELLNTIIAENNQLSTEFSKILKPEGYGVANIDNQLKIQGGIVVKNAPVINEAHFQDIQNRILKALDDAQVSITLVIAWFTNQVLFDNILEKQSQGIEVKLAIFDDGINKKHGVDVTKVPHFLLKKGLRGGLMHNKFCVIDNQVVITGSYNWSTNAEFKNDENVTIEYDPKQATKYSVEFRRLTK